MRAKGVDAALWSNFVVPSTFWAFLEIRFSDEVPNLATSMGRAATFITALVHEDCEHLTTKQFARTTDL